MQAQQVYEVKRIVAHRLRNGQYTYRVHWAGYSKDEDTWEPEEHLDGAEGKLKSYWRKRGEVQRANWFVHKYGNNAEVLLEQLDRVESKIEATENFSKRMEFCRARKCYEQAIAKVTPAAPIGVQLQPQVPATSPEETPVPSPETEQEERTEEEQVNLASVLAFGEDMGIPAEWNVFEFEETPLEFENFEPIF